MRRTIGGPCVGRGTVEVEVANSIDLGMAQLGLIEADKVRRQKGKGVVDSGATKFVLPRAVVEQLGLPINGKVRVRSVDGRPAPRPAADGAYVELLGRHGIFAAVVEPKRKDALIGVIVLEDLDLLLDCPNERLIPRDPRNLICELE